MTKTSKPSTRRSRGAKKPLVIIWLVAIGLLVAASIYAVSLIGPAPPRKLTLAAGSPGGAYAAYAERYRKLLKKQGIEVEVRTTEGSLENLGLLLEEKADIAFVQTGTAKSRPESEERLRGIACLFYEPLWIFHKGDNHVTTLADLKGQRLAIGSKQSGTNAVVRQLLQLNGIDDENSKLLELGMEPSADAIVAGKADYAFLVASPRAEVVSRLIADPSTHMVGIRRYEAYVRNVLFVKGLEIAEGTFDLRQNVPSEDLAVLSTLGQLICRADLHPAMVELLARTARDVHSGGQLLERGGEFPNADNLEIPIAEAASDYFQSGPSLLARYMPFWLAQLLKRIAVLAIPLITLMIPLFKVAPTAYKAVMRRRIHSYYDDLDRIEESMVQAKHAAELDECLQRVDDLAETVATGIEVPTSFRNEEYDLRLHIAQVRGRVLDRKRG
ncbi:MAG: TAXI family TRAP transporter solute-binding subunit [Planctomycetota bacterium]